MKYFRNGFVCLLGILLFTGCAGKPEAPKEETAAPSEEPQAEAEPNEEEVPADPVLLYQGHASLRIETAEGKTIYIDPFSGEGYEKAADLILMTHDHYDHTATDLIADRAEDCTVISWNEALSNGQYGTFDLGYVMVEAVQAGNNPNHSINECVGYILTFSNGVSLYVSGDTSETEQMASLKDRNIDYAFFCCDGVYNMNADEASHCAELVGAVHSIPYHTAPATDGYNFDSTNAERFSAEGRIILDQGEELVLQP